MLVRLMAKPEDFLGHIRLCDSLLSQYFYFSSLFYLYSMAGATILGVAFGLDINSKDDPYISLVEKSMHSLSMAANPGSYLGLFYSY